MEVLTRVEDLPRVCIDFVPRPEDQIVRMMRRLRMMLETGKGYDPSEPRDERGEWTASETSDAVPIDDSAYRDEAARWVTSLSPAERSEVSAHVADPGINDFLRHGWAGEGQRQWVETAVATLDGAISKGKIPSDGVVWRGTELPGFEEGDDPALLMGAVISEDGYTSTTLDRDVTDDFITEAETPLVLCIHVTAGQAGGSIQDPSLTEFPDTREILLPRGAQFRITGVETSTRRGGADGRPLPVTLLTADYVPPTAGDGPPSSHRTDDGRWRLDGTGVAPPLRSAPVSHLDDGDKSYDPDEPRDEHGEWTASEVTGSHVTVREGIVVAGPRPFLGWRLDAPATLDRARQSARSAQSHIDGGTGGPATPKIRDAAREIVSLIERGQGTGPAVPNAPASPGAPRPPAAKEPVIHNLTEADRTARRLWKPWIDALSPADRDNIEDITSLGGELNARLHGLTDDKTSGLDAESATTLDRTIQELFARPGAVIPKDLILYRWVEWTPQMKAKFKPGKDMDSRAYTSTTLAAGLQWGEKGTARITIWARKGAPAIYLARKNTSLAEMSPGSEPESDEIPLMAEVLLPKGARLHILKVSETPGSLEDAAIEAEYLPPPAGIGAKAGPPDEPRDEHGEWTIGEPAVGASTDAPRSFSAGKEAEDYVAPIAARWAAGLSPAETEAVSRYTAIGSSLNAVYRGTAREATRRVYGIALRETGGVDRTGRDLQSALARSTLPDSLVLHRGVELDRNGLPPRWLSPGTCFTDDGFVSTSLVPTVAARFGGCQIEVDAPAGSPGAVIGPSSTFEAESEILFPRGSRFRVLSVSTLEPDVAPEESLITARIQLLPGLGPVSWPDEVHPLPDHAKVESLLGTLDAICADLSFKDGPADEPRDDAGRWTFSAHYEPTQAEASEYLDSRWSSWREGLSQDERDALFRYMTIYHRSINGGLRWGPDSSLPGDESAIRHLDSALARSRLPESAILWRAASFSQQQVDALKPGAVIDDPAFVSTTLRRDVVDLFGGNVLMEIHAPAGAPGAPPFDPARVPGFQNKESEILLPRGSSFRVRSFREAGPRSGYVWKLEADLLPSDDGHAKGDVLIAFLSGVGAALAVKAGPEDEPRDAHGEWTAAISGRARSAAEDLQPEDLREYRNIHVASDALRRGFAHWKKSLDAQETHALRSYVGVGGCVLINSLLRTGAPYADPDAEGALMDMQARRLLPKERSAVEPALREAAAGIESACRKGSAPESVLAFRTLSLPDEYARSLKAGSIIDNAGFTSVTLNRGWAEQALFANEPNVTIQVAIPKGTPCAFGDPFNAGAEEAELILPPGARIRVNAVETRRVRRMFRTESRIYVDADLVGSDEKSGPADEPRDASGEWTVGAGHALLCPAGFDALARAHADEPFKAASEAWRNGLSEPETEAIQEYTQTFQVNGYLRDPQGWLPWVMDPKVRHMDRAIGRWQMPEDRTLYRGFRSPELRSIAQGSEDLSLRAAVDWLRTPGHEAMGNAAVGKVISDRAFVSTTLHEPMAFDYAASRDSVVIRIKAKRGQNAAYVDQPGLTAVRGEGEVILPRGSSFRITSYGGLKQTRFGPIPVFDVEILPPEGS